MDFIIHGDDQSFIKGGADSDLIIGGLGIDIIRGGDGDDRIRGGVDIIPGVSQLFDSGDSFFKRAYDIYRAARRNSKDSGDNIEGGKGRDTIYGEGGGDVIRGEDGADILYGGQGLDKLFGGKQDDTLWGGIDGDSLDGGSGRNVLRGEGGPDRFDIGDNRGTETGVDRAFGGPGKDTFNISGQITGFKDDDLTGIEVKGNRVIARKRPHVIQGDSGADTFNFVPTSTAPGGFGAKLYSPSQATRILDYKKGVDEINFELGKRKDFVLDIDENGTDIFYEPNLSVELPILGLIFGAFDIDQILVARLEGVTDVALTDFTYDG